MEAAQYVRRVLGRAGTGRYLRPGSAAELWRDAWNAAARAELSLAIDRGYAVLLHSVWSRGDRFRRASERQVGRRGCARRDAGVAEGETVVLGVVCVWNSFEYPVHCVLGAFRTNV